MFVLVNDEKIELPKDSTARDLAKNLNLTSPEDALAVNINGIDLDLCQKLNDKDIVKFLSFEDKKGKEIFWHTSAHVLAQAIKRLHPKATPTIGPSIENGFYYDFANLEISEKDFPKIEKEIKKIISENLKPEKKIFSSKKEALEAYKENPYKKELIESFDETPISSYTQGDFSDLCRGPHLPNLGKIKAFKILKTSGAYWKGDQSREMLTRIYGISFPDKQQLQEYLHFLEEAKKREHKALGTKLKLFSFKEAAPGMPFFHPHGIVIWNALVDFLNNLLKDDYEEIRTPLLMNKELWEKSGHWFHYKENMYTSIIEDKEFALKPMSCPGCMLYYRTDKHSYRELPLRVSEIGLVHRHEMSGSLNGLFRVRSFHQDDAHIFMKPTDIKNEILKLLELADTIYSTFGLTYQLELSTRPEKSKTIGSDQDWEIATEGLKQALDEWKKPYKINEGDGAFYGPKIDIHIKDALHRLWQCGTIQLDMALPERFDLEYVDSDGTSKRPIMIHRALFGSLERFYGILVEHFGGKFPLWISPRAVRIIPVADRHNEYAEKIMKTIKKHGITCDTDCSNESVSKKVRNAQLLKINYMLTVGDTEVNDNTISLRTRDNKVHGQLEIDDFLKKILEEKTSKSLTSPFEGEA